MYFPLTPPEEEETAHSLTEQQQHQTTDMDSRTSLLELTRRLRNYSEQNPSQLYLPFLCEGQQVSLVGPEAAEHLQKYPDVLTVSQESVVLSPGLDSPQKRTEGLEKILLDLRDRKIFPSLSAWRNEKYEIKTSFSSKALFEMERSATSLFGVRVYSCQINGYVNHSTLGLCLWMQKRSMTQTWPGMMDNFVGGGLPAGMGVRENAIKEAGEEANVPEHLAAQMKQTGSVSFLREYRGRMHPETVFVFDLELPETFSPGNTDGEVESFRLVPVEEVRGLICCEESFKITSSPVVLDWLVRNGIVTPETDPDYPAILENIHTPVHQLFSKGNRL